MHLSAEQKLLNAIGRFSTTAPLFRNTSGFNDHEVLQRTNNQGVISSEMLPGQCQAFLNSNIEFLWFVEEYSIVDNDLVKKQIYPAKVTGLNLPLISAQANPVTLRWRDGLVRWGNVANSPVNYDLQTGNFRPGFGEIIPADLQRPFRTVTVPINNIGLAINTANQNYFTGPAGRLFSMAFYVDPEIATKYKASKNKKKKKSPNSQDYEQTPTYPPYTPYSGGGYGG